MGYPAKVPVRYFKGGDIVVIGSKVYTLERTCKIYRITMMFSYVQNAKAKLMGLW